MCPEPVQKFLADQHFLGMIKTYEEYKDAIDRYFYQEKRWNRKRRTYTNVPRAAQMGCAKTQVRVQRTASGAASFSPLKNLRAKRQKKTTIKDRGLQLSWVKLWQS